MLQQTYLLNERPKMAIITHPLKTKILSANNAKDAKNKIIMP